MCVRELNKKGGKKVKGGVGLCKKGKEKGEEQEKAEAA